jgi:hypothetical protein
MRALSEYTLEELQREFTGWGFKPAHAAHVLRAHYAQESESPLDGLLLPKSLSMRLLGAPKGAGFSPVARQEGPTGPASSWSGLVTARRSRP